MALDLVVVVAETIPASKQSRKMYGRAVRRELARVWQQLEFSRGSTSSRRHVDTAPDHTDHADDSLCQTSGIVLHTSCPFFWRPRMVLLLY